jgi:hypothetical protein
MSPQTLPAKLIDYPDWSKTRVSTWQWDFIADSSKLKILDAGRGAGKTFIIVQDALLCAHEVLEERDGDFPRPGPRVVIAFVAPNKQNMRELWAMIKFLVPRPTGKTKDGEKNFLIRENEKTIFLYGMSRGIEVRLYSGVNPNSMRGASIDILVCDEWAFCGYSKEKKRVQAENDKGGDEVYFTILQKTINRAFSYGKVTIASTPFSNYFDDWCQQSLHFQKTGEITGPFSRFSFHHATAEDNDFLEDAQILDIRDEALQHRQKYEQERLGRLHVVFPRSTAQNHAFTTELVDSCLIEALPTPSKGPYAVGIDISWMGSDWLCVWVADTSLNVLVHIELHHKTDITDITNLMHRLHKDWKLGPGRLGYDATGEGKTVTKILPKDWETVPVFFWDNQKPHLVRGVELRMQHAALRIPSPETFDFSTLPQWNAVDGQDQKANFMQAVKELRDYRKRTDELPSGERRVRYMKGDVEGRDDCMDALSVLCQVMPPIALPSTGKTKERLRDKFNRAYGGGIQKRAA